MKTKEEKKEEKKVFQKLYRATPKNKAYVKAYHSTPEFKAKRKARNATPEVKAKNKIYNATPERKAYRKNHLRKPEVKASRKIYNAKPEIKRKYKKYRLRRKFGLTPEQYEQMLNVQESKCGICGKHQKEFKIALAVDHDHKTNEIRGLLCSKCNRLLGDSNDNSETLLNAIQYLNKHNKA